jgi:MscS family membrane protein
MVSLGKVFYGNTLLDWTISLFMVLGSVLLGRALYWVFGVWARQRAKKTNTQLDAQILHVLQSPALFLIAFVGARLSLARLHFSDDVQRLLSNVFSIVLSLCIAWLLTRAYRGFHEGYLVPAAARSETSFDDQILPVLRSGVGIVLWSLGLIVGLNNAGINVGALVAGMGLGGLAFALAAQDTIANVFGGITIFVQKPFKIGDLIIFDGRTGRVKEVGLRSTRLEDFTTSHAVYVPNSQFAKNAIINVSADPGHWVSRTYRLAPNTGAAKVEQAIALVREAAGSHPDVDKNNCRLNSFDQQTIELYSEFHVRNFADRWRVITEVHLAIMQRFEQNGIRFAFPLWVVHENQPPRDEHA